MGKVDGRLIALKFENATLVGRTTGSFNFAADMLPVTTADSAGHKEFIKGEDGGTIEVGGLYDPIAVEGFSEAFGYCKAGTPLTCIFGQTTAGSTYYTGEGLISSVALSGDVNTPASYTLSIQLTGEITEGTVASS